MSDIRLHALEEQVDALAGRLAVLERLARRLAQDRGGPDAARGSDRDEMLADLAAREHRSRRLRQVDDIERLSRQDQAAVSQAAALHGLESRLQSLEQSVNGLRRA